MTSVGACGCAHRTAAVAANAKLLSQTAHPAPPGPGRGEARGHQRSRGAPSSGGQNRESKSREDKKAHGLSEGWAPSSAALGRVLPRLGSRFPGSRQRVGGELPSPSGASRLDSLPTLRCPPPSRAHGERPGAPAPPIQAREKIAF